MTKRANFDQSISEMNDKTFQKMFYGGNDAE